MLEARITIDPDDRTGAIDPMIYGHFIEHLGRCIEGGIWGEMLHARRFAGFDDDHNGLADPWRKVAGRAPHLLIDPPECAGGGWLTMRCLRDTDEYHEIAHPGLLVRKGKTYSVEADVRTSPGIERVRVALGGDALIVDAPGADGARIAWTAEARWDSDDAALTIGCAGEGEMEVRAPSVMRQCDREIGGYRADVVELVRAISPPIVRWPGGCFADGYRWRDGVGERSERMARFDPAWGAWDDNDFGTEEFAAFCRIVGAEPYICVNTGSASAESAAEWVRFCAERNLGVRYWGVGNETYGSWEIGNVPAEEYAHLFLEFAEAMRAEDPAIELIAVGADPVDHPKWNPTVLEIAGVEMDHLSIHRYVPHRRDDDAREAQYRAIVAAPVDVERRLRMVADTIDEIVGPDSGVGIAFDEWNVWMDADRDILLEERYELRDALFAAGVFNALHRMGGRISMANLAQLVNVLPAITTTRGEAWPTAVYRAFELYQRCGPTAISTACDCAAFDTEAFGNIPGLTGAPWLDASATLSNDESHFVLAIVNRHPTESFRITVDAGEPLCGAEQATLGGASEQAENSAETPAAVAVHSRRIDLSGGSLKLEVPAHAATVVRLARSAGHESQG